MARKNVWEQIWESTEGSTVTVTIPRDHAESLLRILAASLEWDGDGDMDDDDIDMDSVRDLDFDDDDDVDGAGDMDVSVDDGDMDLDFDEDDEDEEPAPRRGPGRPPGSKNKKGSIDGKKKDVDEKEDDDTKEEGVGRYRSALGESAFARAARALAKPREKR